MTQAIDFSIANAAAAARATSAAAAASALLISAQRLGEGI